MSCPSCPMPCPGSHVGSPVALPVPERLVRDYSLRDHQGRLKLRSPASSPVSDPAPGPASSSASSPAPSPETSAEPSSATAQAASLPASAACALSSPVLSVLADRSDLNALRPQAQRQACFQHCHTLQRHVALSSLAGKTSFFQVVTSGRLRARPAASSGVPAVVSAVSRLSVASVVPTLSVVAGAAQESPAPSGFHRGQDLV